MAVTSYSEFIEKLASLDVEDGAGGFVKKYAYPPASISTADLPIAFPRLPGGRETPITLQSNGGWPILRCQYLVILSPLEQGLQGDNFSDAVAMMDNVAAAMAQDLRQLLKTVAYWDIQVAEASLAGTTYWAVVVDITVNGQ